MPEATLYSWVLRADPAVTASFQEVSYFLPTRGCCPACETLIEATERPVLPRALLEFLRTAGADPLRPQEVWGATDSGFLNAWWVIGGRIVQGPLDADDQAGYVEPLPGLRVWATPRLAMIRPEGFRDSELVQIEFLWNDQAVVELDHLVWSETAGEPAVDGLLPGERGK